MARRSGVQELREDEIISRLGESDIDLSDIDEDDDATFTPRPEEDKESSSSSSDEEIDSHSEVSLQSSVVNRGRSRGRTRTFARRGERRSSNARGRILPARNEVPISDGWNGQFMPLQLPFYQPNYKKVETELWIPEDYFAQYIKDDILEEMVSATNRTNILRKGNTLGLTIKELKVFFGIQMVMSAK